MVERLDEDTDDLDEGHSRRRLRLLRRLLLYHAALAVLVVLVAVLFPNALAQLPIGGMSELIERGEQLIGGLETAGAPGQQAPADSAAGDLVGSLADATAALDRLGYARRLVITLVGLWLLMLPVSWVHRGVHASSVHDHSLDEATLILPGVVAAIVLVVQHSLALAFSLAGIIAGVQFRRALQDTFDALFILVAIGAGIAAGVEALEIAAVLTVFFSYATFYVYFYGDGLESDFEARKKREKRLRKAAAAEQPTPPADTP